MNLYLSKPFTFINKVIIAIWILIGLFLTAQTGLAQDGSDVTFEADTVIIEQDDSIMVARGNVRVTHEDELLEAQSLEYNHLTGTAIAIGEVKLKTNDGAEYRADKMFLDNNFKLALANPLISLLSNDSKFSLKKNNERKRKRTVFDRSAFSPCNCDFDKVESPIWDLKVTSSEQNPLAQTITHYNVELKIFGLPKSIHPLLALSNTKGENKINYDKSTIANLHEIFVKDLVRFNYYSNRDGRIILQKEFGLNLEMEKKYLFQSYIKKTLKLIRKPHYYFMVMDLTGLP